MQNIKHYAKKILDELQKPEYCIDMKDINRLVTLYNNMSIVQDDCERDIRLSTSDTKTEIGTVNILDFGPCFVLQHPPVIINGNYEKVNPVISVAKFINNLVYRSCIYHELAHLFSISDWIILPNEITHYSGVMMEKYEVLENKIIGMNKYNYLLADEVNDWVAMTLFKIIEKENYYFNSRRCKSISMRYIQNQILNGCKGNTSIFIGYYFSNNIEAINSILCSGELNTFYELEQFLDKIYHAQANMG